MTRLRVFGVACASLLIGAALVPAQAAELNVLGVSVGTSSTANGGTGVTVGAGSATVGATVGGGTNVASVNTNATGSNTTVGVGTATGNLIASTTNATAPPPTSISAASALH